MTTTKLALTLLTLAGLTTAADLPSGEQLINRHIEATGGASAWMKIRTQEMQAITEIVGQGIRGKTSAWYSGGDRSRTVVAFDGMGEIQSGVAAGGKAWSNSAMQGPRILDGTEKKQAIRAARFNQWANWKSVYGSLTTEAAEDIAGQPAWRVTAVPLDGDRPETLWFDRKTGRVVRSRMIVATPMGDIPVDTTTSDYRKVGAVEMPFVLEQKLGPQTLRTTVESIRLDTEIDSARFEPPAEVKALAAPPAN